MKKWMVLLLVGCVDNTLPGPGPAAVTVMCSQNGASCQKPDECCSGFCQIAGVYQDNWRTCAEPLADGLYCTHDYECQSKQCLEYRCGGVGLCAGESCASDDNCCRGTFCYNETYAPWMCVLLSDDGAWCTADSHCRSGRCTDYVCVP